VVTAAAEPLAYFLPRPGLDRFIAALAAGGREVIGPTVADGTIVLSPVTSAAQLPVGAGLDNAPGRSRLVQRADERIFDQPVGPMSWKNFTFPARVTQLTWQPTDEGMRPAPPRQPVPPRAFLGVRACEIAALRIHDRVLRDGPTPDGDYAGRRADNLIVAVECAVAGGTCFCSTMGTGPEVTDGYDLALSELDDGFVVRVGSPAGVAAIAGLELALASAEQTAAAHAAVGAVRAAMKVPFETDGLAERLIASAESPRWAQIAERCLACANCTLVCPTCFCTNATQRSDLDGGSAATERNWDSCFTLDFARVAGGNFRTRPADRYRQWLTHKFGTWWDQFGSAGCVGCGRCITWCPVGIDIRDELVEVTATAPPPETAAPPGATGDRTAHAHALATPSGGQSSAFGQRPAHASVARVVGKWRETGDTVTLRLATGDPDLLAGRPGQFVMAALPAVAAPPISVSRFRPDGIELTVRAAGPATARICALERGDSLSLRGPFGRGWPVETADRRDVMIITGGIGLAPLRPLLDSLVARRERIGVIHLAYGARTPHDRLYMDELDALAASGIVEVAQTVDRAGPEWLGRVGVVTQVIDRVLCSCERTVAFVCGPERMMHATAQVLRERGISDEHIFVTMERHMECGAGLCGHCQLGRFFVCRDGPVFSLAELGPAFQTEGL
jgi:NAD(P)H-flavin reductase/formate hydrogenlyase subunit 6/NADH:ubiquinone oxidoreductase subunit I